MGFRSGEVEPTISPSINQGAGHDPDLPNTLSKLLNKINLQEINLHTVSTKEMQDFYEAGLINQENLHLLNEKGQNAVVSKIQNGDIEAARFLLYHGFNPSMRISSNSRDATSVFIKEYRIKSRPIIHPGGGQNDENLLPALDFAERRLSAIDAINKGDNALLKISYRVLRISKLNL